jgi:hypothetical protein
MQGSLMPLMLRCVGIKLCRKNKFTYARYIDYLVMLTPTRVRLRKAIKITYQALNPRGYNFVLMKKLLSAKLPKVLIFVGLD